MRGTLFAAAVLAAACSRAGEESEAKRSPKTPPPPSVEIPAGLRIEVEVDGEPAAPITRDRLAAIAPDYADGERSAWKLAGLLGATAERPGAVIEAIARDGQGVLLRRSGGTGAQPVLFLTRRGDVVAAVVDPEEPFPPYHGQGGQLQRPGDRRPRLTDVVRLRVRVDNTDVDRSAVGVQALGAIELSTAGKSAKMTADQVAALPRLKVQGDEGDERAAWSLRDLAAAVAGAAARVVAVTGEDGRVAIAPERWKDRAVTPILRANRRGELKLMWIDASGTPSLEGEVRAVSKIELE